VELDKIGATYSDTFVAGGSQLGWTCGASPQIDPCGVLGTFCGGKGIAGIYGLVKSISKTYTGLEPGQEYYLDLDYFAIGTWEAHAIVVETNSVRCFGATILRIQDLGACADGDTEGLRQQVHCKVAS
jgi:hypothetical protein